jgi:hypothetical protein
VGPQCDRGCAVLKRARALCRSWRALRLAPDTNAGELLLQLCSAEVIQNGYLLSRRGRSLTANASGFDTHRDSISIRFDCRACADRTCTASTRWGAGGAAPRCSTLARTSGSRCAGGACVVCCTTRHASGGGWHWAGACMWRASPRSRRARTRSHCAFLSVGPGGWGDRCAHRYKHCHEQAILLLCTTRLLRCAFRATARARRGGGRAAGAPRSGRSVAAGMVPDPHTHGCRLPQAHAVLQRTGCRRTRALCSCRRQRPHQHQHRRRRRRGGRACGARAAGGVW